MIGGSWTLSSNLGEEAGCKKKVLSHLFFTFLCYLCLRHFNKKPMKQNIRLLLAAVLSGFLLAACGESHFLTDASYREQVRQDFERKQALMPQGDLFAVFQTDLTAYEREALEFLYASMPLADITG